MRTVTDDRYIYPDGREVCRTTPAGRVVYYERKRMAWEAQGRRCAICDRPISLRQATVDHKEPRGMGGGRRDDRQENIQAACWGCNGVKGSRR